MFRRHKRHKRDKDCSCKIINNVNVNGGAARNGLLKEYVFDVVEDVTVEAGETIASVTPTNVKKDDIVELRACINYVIQEADMPETEILDFIFRINGDVLVTDSVGVIPDGFPKNIECFTVVSDPEPEDEYSIDFDFPENIPCIDILSGVLAGMDIGPPPLPPED